MPWGVLSSPGADPIPLPVPKERMKVKAAVAGGTANPERASTSDAARAAWRVRGACVMRIRDRRGPGGGKPTGGRGSLSHRVSAPSGVPTGLDPGLEFLEALDARCGRRMSREETAEPGS